MTKQPKVSIIMPTYNRATLLPRAIASILMQTFDDFELIIVDDASTDETAEVVGSFGDPRVRYLQHETNRGGPAARNTGVAAARGEYIAFQDSDDEWLVEKLARQVACLDACPPEVGVVYCGILRWDGTDASYFPPTRIGRREGVLLPQLLRRSFIFTQTLLIRRRCFAEIDGGFDERLPRFQEWDLVIRLSRVTEFRLVDEPLVIAYETPDSLTRNKQVGVTARTIILEKHEDLLREHPKALAEHLCDIGHLSCLYHSPATGRQWFARALRSDPVNLRALAGWVFSLFGADGYRRCLRAMGRNVSD